MCGLRGYIPYGICRVKISPVEICGISYLAAIFFACVPFPAPGIIQIVPIFFNGVFGASVSFGGTSLIIIVSVILETLKQIESQMLVIF